MRNNFQPIWHHGSWIDCIACKEKGHGKNLPNPINRSRVLTIQAIMSDTVANKVAARITIKMTLMIASGFQLIFTPKKAEIEKTMIACDKLRTPADNPLPSTRAARGVGLTKNFCTIPKSRSQMTLIPKKIAMKRTL